MIAAGSRLGPYEIAAPLGAGGMGEVYRARDSRLDRTVAIKVLPRQFSSNEALRARFEREARAISALSHPHICTLYDIGRDDGIDFLVMEYLDGDSLAERLARGPLPIEQVIRFGVEIAEALEKAHRAGIVHRDLKPGNVILTKSGAKLLDFGLAKFSSPQQPTDPNALTAAMSESKPLTEEGTILGTFQYMAPEQLDGRDADARTDIFAFGVLLYEMATGRRAFDATTRASLIAAILDRDPPPISAAQPLAPPGLQRVVSMCLAKDPDERWQSAHDIAAELRWLRDTSSETIGPGARRSRRKRLAQAGALVLAGLLGGGLLAWLAARDGAAPGPVARFAINTAPNAPLWMFSGSMDISPDGTRIVYRSFHKDKQLLYVRSVGSPSAVPLAGTENAYAPVFSPDGQWIAYLGDRTLRKVPAGGGTPVDLTPVEQGAIGIDWVGNTLYYSPSFLQGIRSIDEHGGQSKQVVRLDTARNYRAIVWPEVLPGGEALLATVWTGTSFVDSKIVAYSLQDGTERVLIEGGSQPRYSKSGHLLYARGSSVMAVAFDPRSLKTSGTPVTVIDHVAFDTTSGNSQFALSDSGHLIFAPGGLLEPRNTLLAVDRSGTQTPLVPTQRAYDQPVVSTDGRVVATVLTTATFDVWLLDPERDLMTRLSFGGDDLEAAMAPDGQHVYWSSGRSGTYNLYRAATDGSGSEELLVSSPVDKFMGAVSHDNRFAVYYEWKNSQGDIWILPLDTRKPRPLLVTPHSEIPRSISADGKWLLYRSDESGRRELYVRSLEGPPRKWQVSVGGGSGGGFTKDGREILYRFDSKIYSVPVETSPQFRAGKPRLLFENPDFEVSWDVAGDG